MSSSGERITAAELERSKRARTIARNWLEAEETRMKLAGLDPAIEGDGTPGVQMRPSKFGRPSPLDRVREARVSGMEVRSFEQGLAGADNQSKPQLATSDIAGAKSRIVEALIRAGKTSDQIQEYMDRISPAIDVYGLSNDPAVQAILFSKVMGNSGTQQLGLKDVVETIKMVNDMKGPQQQNPAELVQAMGSMFTAGVNAAKNNGSDPMAAFNSAVQFITPIMQEQTATVRASFENQLAMLRTELQSKDPATFFDKMRTFAETMGWRPSGTSDPEVLTRQLELQDKSDQRAFELSKTKWEKEWEMKMETNKQKAQGDLLNNVLGTAQKAFESPVVRELGRNVGSKLGVRENPLTKAQTTAAQAELANPTEVPYSFRCPQCSTNHSFSAKQLTLIKEAGGKWVCPKCASPYELGKL